MGHCSTVSRAAGYSIHFLFSKSFKRSTFSHERKKNNNNTEMLIFQTNILAALVIFHFIFACPLSVAHVFFLIT